MDRAGFMREPVDAPPGRRLRKVLIQRIPAIGTIMESALPQGLSRNGLPNDVLIVEDDPIIALDFEDRIIGFGVKAVRCAASVAHALMMIDERAPDFALLDVGLARGKSFDVADRLVALTIPFAFVTGYGGDHVDAAYAAWPRLSKPCSSESLLAALRRFRDTPRS
jgi:CheY-like chemotaxis protein